MSKNCRFQRNLEKRQFFSWSITIYVDLLERKILEMRRGFRAAAILLFLVGVAVLAYYPLSGLREEAEKEKVIRDFHQEMEKTGETEYSELLTAMREYNKTLFETGQSSLQDAWSYEQSVFDLREYGLDTEIIGTIYIPAMGEELPVYLGATEENMARGVAVMGQTSMPVGGENTNCVIAGHRGYGGEAIFREIEALSHGDWVYLTTIFGNLEYKVDGIRIIEPDDMDAIRLQAGKDMLTLITCHPYAVGSQRYVVYCSAVSDAREDSEASGTDIENTEVREWEASGSESSSQQRIRLEKWLPLAAAPLILLVILLLILPEGKKKKTKRNKD